MSSTPDYSLPEYGLDASQLGTIEALGRLLLWERRVLRKNMGEGGRGPFIYRYMSFADDGLPLKKAKDMIVESKLYLSSPSEFNDPYDFRAFVTFDEDPVKRRSYFEKSARSILRQGRGILKDVKGRGRKIEEMASRAMTKSLNSPNSPNDIFDRARDKNGVACFSEDPRGLLLWAHYAASHTGICLQFDVTLDPGVLLITHRVNYRKQLAHLVWPRDRDELVDKVILAKDWAWKHEKEVRYVSLHVVRDTLLFDGRALRAIILGARFPEKFISVIEHMIEQRAKRGLPVPTLYKARQREREYGIYLAKYR